MIRGSARRRGNGGGDGLVDRCRDRDGLFFDLHRLGTGNGDSKCGAGCRWKGHGGEAWTCGLREEVGQVEQRGRAVRLGTGRAGGSACGSRGSRGGLTRESGVRRDHRNFAVIRVRARGDTWCGCRVGAGESLNGSVENGGNRLVKGFAVMTTSGSVWIWVSGGGRNGDWLDVSFEDSGGAGMARGSKRLGSDRIRRERGLTLRWARMGWMLANGSLEANFCLGIHGWLVRKTERD